MAHSVNRPEQLFAQKKQETHSLLRGSSLEGVKQVLRGSSLEIKEFSRGPNPIHNATNLFSPVSASIAGFKIVHAYENRNDKVVIPNWDNHFVFGA